MFFLIYLTVYGGMNAYSLWTLYHSLHGGWQLGSSCVGLALFAVGAPLLVHRLEAADLLMPARILALMAYCWMALVFWLFLLCLAKDLWNAGLRLGALVKPELLHFCWPAPWFPRVALLLLGLLFIWGLVEAARIRVRQVTVVSAQLPQALSPLRVALIADLHVGLVARQNMVQKTVGLVARQTSDLVLCAGDLIDAGGPHMDGLLAPFQTLTPRLGKYAVLGNHEFYAGMTRCQELLTRDAGFVVLRNQVASPCPGLQIMGVDDPAFPGPNPLPEVEAALFAASPHEGEFTILLKHRPEFTARARRQASLQLSGHTHKGQIFPFFWMVRQLYPVPHGRLFSLPEGLTVYVSPGTGTWGPPLRVLAPPEITLLEIRSPQQD